MKESNGTESYEILKDILENCKDSGERISKMEATLHVLQSGVEQTEEGLESLQFGQSRILREVVTLERRIRKSNRWMILCIVLCTLCLLVPTLYTLHLSHKTSRELREVKVELKQMRRELNVKTSNEASRDSLILSASKHYCPGVLPPSLDPDDKYRYRSRR